MINVLAVLLASVGLFFFSSQTVQMYKKSHAKVHTRPEARTRYPIPTAPPAIVTVLPSLPLADGLIATSSSIPMQLLSLIPTAFVPTPTINPSLLSQSSGAVKQIGVVRLMPLGDSITDGHSVLGGYRTDLWKRLAGAGYRINFVGSRSSGTSELGDQDHEGHTGWTISQIDSSVSVWIREDQPDIVLLHIGTNDLKQGATAEAMTQSLSKLIGDIFAVKPDTYIVVSSLIISPDSNGTVWSAYNASIPGVVAEYRNQGRKIIALDMSNTLTGSDLVDGTHPNYIGYSKMASMWYPVVATIYKEYQPNP